MVKTTSEVKGRIISLEEVGEYMRKLYALISAEGAQVMTVEDSKGYRRFFLNDCFVDFHVQGYDAAEGGAL